MNQTYARSPNRLKCDIPKQNIYETYRSTSVPSNESTKNEHKKSAKEEHQNLKYKYNNMFFSSIDQALEYKSFLVLFVNKFVILKNSETCEITIQFNKNNLIEQRPSKIDSENKGKNNKQIFKFSITSKEHFQSWISLLYFYIRKIKCNAP